MTSNPVQTLHQTKFLFRNYRQRISVPVKLQNVLTAISQKGICGSFGKKKAAKLIKLIKLAQTFYLGAVRQPQAVQNGPCCCCESIFGKLTFF